MQKTSLPKSVTKNRHGSVNDQKSINIYNKNKREATKKMRTGEGEGKQHSSSSSSERTDLFVSEIPPTVMDFTVGLGDKEIYL